MVLSDKVKDLLVDFVDSSSVKSIETFTSEEVLNNSDVDKIAEMFGYVGSFTSQTEENVSKLLGSFKNNLKLLIQKTWVEKSDVTLKEQILFQLDELCGENDDWTRVYVDFLEIIGNAVYLMFGQQTKSDDFTEYSLRIDPEFGIFWVYVQSLSKAAVWPAEKCREAVLLGMYFLANY